MLSRMPRPSPALVVALIALVVAATGGAMAAIPDADGTVHGCVGARGALRVIEPPATARPARPPSTYRDGPVTLGPYQGGKSGVVASLPLPAGRWVIFAKAWVNSDSANCDLQAGADSDRTLAYAGNTLHANVVHRFTKPSRVVFRCGSQGAIIRMIKVTAIEVDQLTNTPTSS